ncbi:hypothetical protein PR003_g23505 [Phytophthora rubi]|uniref:Uncharacterized protein n=1 Tax=Phytophthora rubi TaxID=129364 RepID=A0A6A4CVE6_9STRA|nr:hypothetical protein PR003_g23505 [Phytophthora rubi]
MDEVPKGIANTAGDDNGPLEEADLPSSSSAKRLTVGSDDTVIAGTDAPLLSRVAKRSENQLVEYLALTTSYETYWLSREALLPEYASLIETFEKTERKKKGLPELLRSAWPADANAEVDEYLLLV